MIAPVSIWVSLLSEVTTKHMKVSREGVILIKTFVGFRSKAVRDDDGRWVIGYGHTASAREGLTVAEPDAELLLQYDLLPVVKGINQGVARPINQHQFDALASFALSIGIDRFLGSDVLQRVNDGLPTQAADALIGWPAPVPIDTATRRRIAERALFNTDPDLPVHLADLLTAPLVAPPAAVVEEPDAAVPPVAPVAARAAAVATLLGEPADQTDQPVSPAAAENPAAEVAAEAPTPAEIGVTEAAAPAPTTDAPESATPAPVPVPGAMQFQRYSPYAAGIVGPLPGLTAVPATPTPTDPDPAPAPATPATPNAAVTMSIRMAVAVEQTATVETPVVADLVEQPSATDTPLPEPAQPEAAEPAPVVAPDDTVVTPFATFAAAPLAVPPLVLTAGSTETPPADDRPVWPEARRPDTTENQEPLFVEEPALSVLRHEIETETPARFEKSQTGAFLIMGGVGLLASAFSAAAFRLALEEPSPMGETTVVAWTLAVIGGVCVVVSSLNLYMRWGRTQRDGTEPS